MSTTFNVVVRTCPNFFSCISVSQNWYQTLNLLAMIGVDRVHPGRKSRNDYISVQLSSDVVQNGNFPPRDSVFPSRHCCTQYMRHVESLREGCILKLKKGSAGTTFSCERCGASMKVKFEAGKDVEGRVCEDTTECKCSKLQIKEEALQVGELTTNDVRKKLGIFLHNKGIPLVEVRASPPSSWNGNKATASFMRRVPKEDLKCWKQQGNKRHRRKKQQISGLYEFYGKLRDGRWFMIEIGESQQTYIALDIPNPIEAATKPSPAVDPVPTQNKQCDVCMERDAIASLCCQNEACSGDQPLLHALLESLRDAKSPCNPRLQQGHLLIE